MRLIVEVFGRAWMFTMQNARLVEPGEQAEDAPEFDHIPVDPHSVGGSQVERGPGADCYKHDVVAQRVFGFCSDNYLRPERRILPVGEPSNLYVDVPDGCES